MLLRAGLSRILSKPKVKALGRISSFSNVFQANYQTLAVASGCCALTSGALGTEPTQSEVYK